MLKKRIDVILFISKTKFYVSFYFIAIFYSITLKVDKIFFIFVNIHFFVNRKSFMEK